MQNSAVSASRKILESENQKFGNSEILTTNFSGSVVFMLNLANKILACQRRSSLLPCLLAGIFRLVVVVPHSRLDIPRLNSGVRRIVPMLAERAMPYAIVLDIV